jgi:AraC-like DNA-binding protein
VRSSPAADAVRWGPVIGGPEPVETAYRQRTPQGAVGRLLRRSYRLDVGDDQRTLVPDGCVDLVWVPSVGRLLVCGTETKGWPVELPNGTRAVGVRFHPGVGPGVLGASGRELAERRVPLGDVCGRRATELVQRLSEAPSPVVEVALLEGFVRDAAAARRDTSEAPPFVHELVQRTLAGGDRSVGELGRAVGLSSRQLQRRSAEVFGYGPVMLARILRLQRFLHLFSTTNESLARLAAEAGYADQAHLARECRSIVGLPPSRLHRAVAGLSDRAPMSDLFAA